jgi:dephospho-CoA kinase
LKKLERIIHPVVRKKMKKFILMKKNKDILIFDIPLLVESNLMHLFDVIIFVDCKKSLRLKRFIKRGGDKSTFKILNKRQTPGRKKVKFCNYKVNNNKNLKDLKKNAKLIMSSYE